MTDQPKWTKGPWAVERNKRTWGWVDVVGPSLGVGGPTRATDLTLADEVKRIAEAHLIAAAPDLYAALERLVDAVSGLSAGVASISADARAALAKARGQA